MDVEPDTQICFFFFAKIYKVYWQTKVNLHFLFFKYINEEVQQK